MGRVFAVRRARPDFLAPIRDGGGFGVTISSGPIIWTVIVWGFADAMVTAQHGRQMVYEA